MGNGTFRALAFMAALSPGAGFATEAPFHCLNDGASAVEPIEVAKQVLIDGRVDELFAEMDKARLFSQTMVERTEAEFGYALDERGALFCLPIQRNDFSDSFVSEIFMLKTHKSFLYVVIYAFNDGVDWTPIRIEFNTSLSALDKHLK